MKIIKGAAMTYDIIISRNTVDLREKLSQLMNEGWAPCGGIAIYKDGYGFPVFMQAVQMVIRDK